MSKSHPTQANGFPVVPDVQRLFAVALALVVCLVSASPVLGQDNDDPNALGQALGNLLVNSITQAIKDSAARSWQQLDPAVLSCLESQYSVDPDQLTEQGIGAGSSKIKPYVKECQRLTAPPPLQIGGFIESTPGLYTRTDPGLANIGSRYAVRMTASAAGGDTREARYNALIAKVKEGCKSDLSIAAIRFYGEKDPNTKANSLNEKWADAEVECADPQAGEDSTDALTVDDLTNGDRGALFFDVHSAELTAPFKGAFDAVVVALHAHAYHILRSDKDKGIIVTGNPGRHEFVYSEACHIILAPETDATTRITLKLVEGSLEPVHNAATLFHPQDHDVVNRRAEQFISEIQQRLGGGHV